jgi:hypothetical protein
LSFFQEQSKSNEFLWADFIFQKKHPAVGKNAQPYFCIEQHFHLIILLDGSRDCLSFLFSGPINHFKKSNGRTANALGPHPAVLGSSLGKRNYF